MPNVEATSRSREIYLRVWIPALRYLFRVEVTGLENIPDESCIFIANHNIGAAVEVTALLDFWQKHFKHRAVHGLTHPFVFKIPVFRDFFRTLGGIPATYDSAYESLESGASLIIFPGGNWEAARPFSQRNLCDFGNHYGWAKIALRSKRRVVPISISGSHSVNLVFLRSRRLVYWFLLPWVLGLSYYPVTAGQFLFGAISFFSLRRFAPTLPMSANLFISLFIFLLSALWPVWPSKIRISIGQPIDLGELCKDSKTEDEKLKLTYATVMARVQRGMDRHHSGSSR